MSFGLLGNEFWHFGNEFWHFENEFSPFEKSFDALEMSFSLFYLKFDQYYDFSACFVSVSDVNITKIGENYQKSDFLGPWK